MKRTSRVVVVAGLMAAVFGAGAVGVATHIGPGRSAPTSPGRASLLQSRPVIASGPLADLVSGLQRRIRANPQDWRSHAQLGMAYVQEARITADASYYPKAEGVLERSLALQGVDNFEAFLGMAALAAARHHFSEALAWAEQATDVNPRSADARAVLGDAQVELGRYREAFDTYQTMIDLRPDLSTYARVSYAWELQGSYRNAVRAMELALQAAGSPVDAAWASSQLADLHFNAGRLDLAADQYRRAIAADDSFIPPHAGLAGVHAARGRIDRAIEDLAWVVERYATPEHVIALGDLYALTGAEEMAERQYRLLEVQERLLREGGVNVDLELALFHADHGVDLGRGLAAARAEWARRPSIHVADALAWTLYANGRPEEAIRYANRSLRLGTDNALFLFHRAMIERALGDRAAARRDLARAVEINPHFSILWSGRAIEVLESLGGAP